MTHFPTFVNWNQFQATVAFVNGMKKRNMYEDFKRTVAREGDFLESKVDNHVVAANWHKLFITIIHKDFTHVHDEGHLNAILSEALMLAYPLHADQSKFILKDHLGNRDSVFKAPMHGSAVRKALRKKGLTRDGVVLGATLADETTAELVAKAQEHTQGTAAAAAKGGKQQKRKGSPKKDKAAPETAETPAAKQARIKESKTTQKEIKKLQQQQTKDAAQEILGENIGEGDCQRGKVWLDDLIATIYGPLVKVAKTKRDDVIISAMIHNALVFAFSGKATVNGTLHTKWSKLRKAIREEIVRAHKDSMQKLPGIANMKTATTSELAEAVCALLDEEPIEECAMEHSEHSNTIIAILEDVDTISGLESFLEVYVFLICGVDIFKSR